MNRRSLLAPSHTLDARYRALELFEGEGSWRFRDRLPGDPCVGKAKGRYLKVGEVVEVEGTRVGALRKEVVEA